MRRAIWWSLIDEETCEACRALHGKIVDVDDPKLDEHKCENQVCRCRIEIVKRNQS